MEDRKFHFAIGRPWHPGTDNTSVGFYTYGNQIFHGTMADAVGLASGWDKYLTAEDIAKRGRYQVYELTQITK